MRIVFCLPGKSFSGKFLQSWTNTVSYCMHNGIEVVMSQRYNSNVYYVRAECLGANVLSGPKQKPWGGQINYDYVMWIDSDVLFNPQQIGKLISNQKDIVGGLYLMEDGKQFATVKDWDEQYFLQHGTFKFLTKEDLPADGNLMEVAYTGFGFLLMKKGVFETIDYPWFEPQRTIFGNVVDFASEDVSFCLKAKRAGFQINIDPKVIVGHEKSQVLLP